MRDFAEKLRVGVVIGDAVSQGGAFVQSVNIAHMLRPQGREPYTVEYIAVDRADPESLRNLGIEVGISRGDAARLLERLLRRLPWLMHFARAIYGMFRLGGLDRLAAKRKLDLLIFTAPSRQIMNLKTTPFVCTVWDLGHREHPEFPELAGRGSYHWREGMYRNALPRASAVIVDSAATAMKLERYYGIDQDRSIVVAYDVVPELTDTPALPEILNSLRSKHGIQGPFVFYPAQFWAHKNHVYILEALLLLKRQFGLEITAVFSGSDQGNFHFVRALAEQMGLAQQIKFVGFLSIPEIAQLYREALALVMPTYLGPTNIPPLEAQALGCPVIYSDLPGFRDFLGPNALYCDLTDPASLSQYIKSLLDQPRPAPRRPQRHVSRPEIQAMIERIHSKLVTWGGRS
jgi:glycosyltransferase involved in cell wall biosynthesis